MSYIGFVLIFFSTSGIMGLPKGKPRRAILVVGGSIAALALLSNFMYPTNIIDIGLETFIVGFAAFCIMIEYGIVFKVID